MEKIYSRRRVHLPKINKVRLIFIIVVSVVITSIISFVFAAYPIFASTCQNKASSIGINVTAEEVNKVMRDYEYEDLVAIEKTESRRNNDG